MRNAPPPLPSLGDWVGEYEVVAKLGEGGCGTVFKARRGTRFYALKFIRGVRGGKDGRDAWGRREASILLNVEHPHVVRLVGIGYWPDEETGCFYLVMEYVEGRTLFAWAEEENPCAREVARKTLEGARALAEVHHQHVVHRDVKGCNLLVREADARVVLVDFGAGGYEGAPRLTRYGLAPGTDLYRSPEAVRFHLDNAHDPHASHPSQPADDLYALGVVLYELLTDQMPFREDLPEARIHELYEEILHRVPESPSNLNPRVPRALSDLCMRLLAKRPDARYASAQELCGVLEAALSKADASWDVPLFASRATAPARAASPAEDDAEVDAEQQWVMEQPGQRRGRGERPSGTREPAPTPARWTLPKMMAWGSLLLMVSLGAWLLSRPTSLDPELASPSASPRRAGHEVAPPAGLPEADGGAAPPVAAIPAPVASATPQEEDTRVKSQKTSSKTGQKESGSAAGWRALTTVAICTAAAGCPAVPVRPPPVDCPPETLSFMREKLGIRVGDYARVVIDNDKGVGSVPIAVPAGDIESELTDDLGKLPGEDKRIWLYGQLFFGKDRVYGRYTKAQLEDFTFVPVCLQLHDRKDGTLGVPKQPGSGPGAALILNVGYVMAVQRFE